MALNDIAVHTVTGVVIQPAREAQAYSGRGADRVATGRVTDTSGRPVSRAAVFAVVHPLGLMEASIEIPDAAAEVLVPGAVIRATGGDPRARMVGGDFGAVRVTISGLDEVASVADFETLVGAGELDKGAGK